MSEKNRDKLMAGILFYKEAIKNSEDREYIKKWVILTFVIRKYI